MMIITDEHIERIINAFAKANLEPEDSLYEALVEANGYKLTDFEIRKKYDNAVNFLAVMEIGNDGM